MLLLHGRFPGLDKPSVGVSHSFAARGRHGVRCDSTIGGVNQKRRPRQQGVMTSTTCADRESAVITPPAPAGTTAGRCDHVTRRRPFRLVPEPVKSFV